MTIYTPYTYLIGWSDYDLWYYGARWSVKKKCLYESGCHPDDLWVAYFTSSKKVKEMIEKCGNPDIIQIRKTFNTRLECQEWEKRVLIRMKTKSDPRWLNDGCYATPPASHNEETRRKISQGNKGKKRTPEMKARYSKSKTGIKFTEEHRRNISLAVSGKKPTEESNKKKSLSIKKLRWYNNGQINKRSESHPGFEWVSGRLPFKKNRDQDLSNDFDQFYTE